MRSFVSRKMAGVWIVLAAGLGLVGIAAFWPKGWLGCAWAQEAREGAGIGPEQGRRVAALREAGVDVSLMIFPVRVLGRPMRNVAEVLGLVLEKQGMGNLEAAEQDFAPPEGATWEETAKLFEEFIGKNAKVSGYALYAEFLGEPKGGPTEVRFIVASAKGELVLMDRQTAADADFKKTAARDPDPLGCSALVARRLFALAGWKEKRGKTEGKFAKLWAEKSGAASAAEQEAMKGRLAKLRAARGKASLTVYPTLMGEKPDAESAGRLAKLLEGAFGGGATAAAEASGVSVSPSSNQQKRMWDLSRGLRERVRANPPPTEYAALAEVLFDPASPGHGGVEVVICDRAGEWVVVEFCNEVHEEWARLKPKAVEDVERVAAAKVAARVASSE